MTQSNVKNSKFLSYVLRHKPEAIGLTLNEAGWADINDLISLANKSDHHLTIEHLHAIVEHDKKGRFSISENGKSIRAVQGHSLKTVDLQLDVTTPPSGLLHGTAERFLDSIYTKGLIAKDRQYVHLTEYYDTAIETGQRYGVPVVLHINSQKMQEDGYEFYQAENNVWLTLVVPPDYISDSQ